MAIDRLVNEQSNRSRKFRGSATIMERWDEEVGSIMLPKLDAAFEGFAVGSIIRMAAAHRAKERLHTLKHNSGMRLFLCLDYGQRERHPCEYRNGHGVDASGRKRSCSCNLPWWKTTRYMTRDEFVVVLQQNRVLGKRIEIRNDVLEFIIRHLHGAQTFADIEGTATEQIKTLLSA